MHSFKRRYYTLDINVGKIILTDFPGVFSKEDRLMIELKDLYKDYERRTSLTLIPFYLDTLEYIQGELGRKINEAGVKASDLGFLQHCEKETKEKLDFE